MSSEYIFGVRKELLITLISIMATIFIAALFFGTKILERDIGSRTKANEFILEIAGQYDAVYDSLGKYIQCVCYYEKMGCKELKATTIDKLQSLSSNTISTKLKASSYFGNTPFFNEAQSQLNKDIYKLFEEVDSYSHRGGSGGPCEISLKKLNNFVLDTEEMLSDYIRR